MTGGAGFIGTNFVYHLMKRYPQYRILVLDALTYAGNLENFSSEIKENPKFRFIRGDVCDAALVLDLVREVDCVVHFAAETHVARSIFDDRKFFKTDVLGTQSVANAVLRNKDHIRRFIHVSTSEVYGTALYQPMDEDHPLNPMTPYAAAKAGADRLVYSYWRTYGLPIVIVRPFNQYGPYQHLEKVIPRFISSALLGEPLTIHGDGTAKRDWLYVLETCERLDLVLHADDADVIGEVFNLGSGFDLDILGIARMILKLLGLSENLITFTPDRPGQVQHHISSTAKAEAVLKVRPYARFQEGLEKTIEWYAANRRWWERMLSMRRVEIVDKDGTVQFY